MKRRILAGILAAAAVGAGSACVTAPAFGHGETTPTIVTKIDGVSQRVPGLDVSIVRDQAARLQVTNRTGREYRVLAKGGDAFIRIGPQGVLANVHSITWYRSGNPDGVGDPPKGVKVGGPPRWEKISDKPSWTWFDHRMHPGTVRVGQQSIDAQSRARLDDWKIPGRLGSERLDVTGHVEFRPLRGNVTTDLTGSPRPAPGVQVQLLHGRLPGLYLANTGERPVTVIGREGEPFARIARDGVQVNQRSITAAEDAVAKGRRKGVATGQPGPPVWRRVSDQGNYAWLDVRARYPRSAPPDSVTDGTSKRLLDRWQVPIEVGQKRIAVRGITTWVPLPEIASKAPKDVDSGQAMELGLGGLGLLVAMGGALVLRRRAAPR